MGVWWSGSWRAGDQPVQDVAAELEGLGYGALWSSGGFQPGLSPLFGKLLEATSTAVVASGVVSIWAATPETIAAAVAELQAVHGGRFLLGLGASHAAIVPSYARPYTHMVEYLDALDAMEPPLARGQRVLAALGPRMLALAGRRGLGAHPYFVPVEHTARARELLGPGPLLAPEVTVVVEDDDERAAELARAFTEGYLRLPNYAQNLRSLGFRDDELTGAGCDRLVDAVVASGSVDDVARRVGAHLEAGADHVCVQVLSAERGFPLDVYRRLAEALPVPSA